MDINTIILILNLCISHPDSLVKETMKLMNVENDEATSITALHCGAMLMESSKAGIKVEVFQKEKNMIERGEIY